MSLPKSVTKINKDGIEFVSYVDQVNFTMRELTRAALRDVGKFICKRFKEKYYSTFRKRKGMIGKYTQYWVKHKQNEVELQIGLKNNAFYGGFQELGTKKQPKLALLQSTVEENMAEIIEIESKYLSALSNEAEALSRISDEEYEGGADA